MIPTTYVLVQYLTRNRTYSSQADVKKLNGPNIWSIQTMTWLKILERVELFWENAHKTSSHSSQVPMAFQGHQGNQGRKETQEHKVCHLFGEWWGGGWWCFPLHLFRYRSYQVRLLVYAWAPHGWHQATRFDFLFNFLISRSVWKPAGVGWRMM